MQTIDIDPRYLRAALITAGEKDIRYYLNGVYLGIRPNYVRVVSTDGARMSVFHLARPAEVAPYVAANIIIPREAIKGIKAQKHATSVSLQYDPDAPKAECRIDFAAKGPIVFRPIDAVYPDYQRIIPRTVSGEAAEFDRAYMLDFDLVGRELLETKKKTRVNLHQNGNCAAAVTVTGVPEFFGVIMPMRLEAKAFEVPAWLDADREHQEPVELNQAA